MSATSDTVQTNAEQTHHEEKTLNCETVEMILGTRQIEMILYV